jgi:hypothetical protein
MLLSTSNDDINTVDRDLCKPVTLSEYTVVIHVGDSSVNDSDVWVSDSKGMHCCLFVAVLSVLMFNM